MTAPFPESLESLKSGGLEAAGVSREANALSPTCFRIDQRLGGNATPQNRTPSKAYDAACPVCLPSDVVEVMPLGLALQHGTPYDPLALDGIQRALRFPQFDGIHLLKPFPEDRQVANRNLACLTRVNTLGQHI